MVFYGTIGGKLRKILAKLRCFIAINLPEAVINILAGLQHEFKKCGADIRWVRPENIHLTLKFLGDTNEEAVENIANIIEMACKEYTAFNFEIFGAGIFPDKKPPRVLWVGLKTSEVLAELQRKIEDPTASLGFKKEKRRFVPHLTLGRFKSSRGKGGLKEKISLYENTGFGSFEIGSVCLMKSDLSPAGAKYSIIKEVFFRK
jgi:2'-5' RNA ligase